MSNKPDQAFCITQGRIQGKDPCYPINRLYSISLNFLNYSVGCAPVGVVMTQNTHDKAFQPYSTLISPLDRRLLAHDTGIVGAGYGDQSTSKPTERVALCSSVTPHSSFLLTEYWMRPALKLSVYVASEVTQGINDGFHYFKYCGESREAGSQGIWYVEYSSDDDWELVQFIRLHIICIKAPQKLRVASKFRYRNSVTLYK